MKRVPCFVFALLACLTPAVRAEAPVDEMAPRAVKVQGTLVNVEEDTLTLHQPGEEALLQCEVNGDSRFLDEEGHEIARSALQPGMAATVQCLSHGSRLVVETVVTKPALETLLGTQSASSAARHGGLLCGECVRVTRFTVSLAVAGETSPKEFVCDLATRFVDDQDQPLAFTKMRPGAKLTVQFVEQSGRMLATRLVLNAAAPRTEFFVGRIAAE